jgi:hypothetical protein
MRRLFAHKSRRLWLAGALLVCGGLGGALAGCPAAHDDYPTTACKTKADCFSDEECVMNVCTLPVDDMAVQGDLYFPHFDLAKPDLEGVDGGPVEMPDLSEVDQ